MRVPLWVRRLIGVPLVWGLTVLLLLAAPLLVPLAAAVSPWLSGHWRALRLTTFALGYLCLSSLGLLAATVLWLASGFGLALRRPAFQRAHYRLLRILLAVLLRWAVRLFRIRVQVSAPRTATYDDGPGAARQPLLVFCRHAGPGDSLLLVHALLSHFDRRPRIILKDALAYDPLVNVLLTRLPNRFVAPRPDPGTAVASVASLAAGLGDHDALVLFPEGANFTERRRARAIERLRRLGLRHHAARAERMRHVLPPRTGGALAAIEAAPGADVVFVAHSGLDELNSVADIWAALPMDEVIQARWWRVRGEHIPRGEAEREDWLYTWWHRMDDWIDACKTGTAPEQTGPPPAGIDRFTER